MHLSNVLHLPGRLLNYSRTLTSRFAIPWLAKFAGAPPFRFARTSLWPGTYIAHVPDRYSLNHEAYLRRGGEFDCRYLEGFIRGNELINGGDVPRYFSLTVICDQIKKEGLTGDVAELGVYKGNTAVLLAALARKLGSTAYLFDTYQGFSVEDLTGVDADKVGFLPTLIWRPLNPWSAIRMCVTSRAASRIPHPVCRRTCDFA